MLGQQLGRYQVHGKIGAGGMGEVYHAHDTHLDRDVALKVLLAARMPDDAARHRLLVEARAASRLNHPNICTVHEAGEIDGEMYIAMEYVEGRPLNEILAEGPLPPDKIIAYGMQLASALAHAHQNGVVHGDLKSANVIVTAEGYIKLVDFGLAWPAPVQKKGSNSTLTVAAAVQPRKMAGTLAYMAPEQLRGALPSVGSDIWSLGILLYEMAVRKVPFGGDTQLELGSAILEHTCPTLLPTAPAGLNVIVQHCLEKKAEQRYQSAAEVKSALEAIDPRTREIDRPIPPKANVPLRWALALVIVALAAVGTWLGLRNIGPGAPPRTWVAVLPMANLSPDASQEYFSDGMTDELITELGGITALKVISRPSVMRFKGTKLTVPEIARELNVGTVIVGSVFRAGNRVRISVQLTDGKSDQNLWAHSYEREMQDVMKLQADVAEAIAAQVKAKLTPQEEQRFAQSAKVDPEAYQFYLQGRYFWNQRTPEGFQKALEMFQAAIKKDPHYAPAYCGLADTYLLQYDYRLLSWEDSNSLGRAAALKAIELDPTLAEAHTSLGAVLEDYDHDWPGAEREYRKAIELNPSYATAHQWYGTLLSVLGRHDEAIAQEKQATELAPLLPRPQTDLGYALFHARRYDKAIEAGETALKMDPNSAAAHYLLGRADLIKKRFDQAAAEFETGSRLSNNRNSGVALVAYAEAMSGRKDTALAKAKDLAALPQSDVPYYQLAMVYTALGDKDAALNALQNAITHKQDVRATLIGVEVAFDPLRGDPRFHALLKQLQLPH